MKKYYFACYLSVIIIVLLQLSQSVSAQQTPKLADSVQTIPDTLLFKIQKAQAAVTEVNAANKKGYDIEGLRNRLDDILKTIEPLKNDLKAKAQHVDTKSLQSYNLILKDAGNNLTGLRTILMKHNSELQRMSDEVVNLSSDSLLSIKAGDEVQKRLYAQQLRDIKLRLQDAGKLTGANLDQVSRLLAEVSALDIVLNDLKTLIDDQIQRSGKIAAGKEAPYLWNAPFDDSPQSGIGEQIAAAFTGQKQILSYFLNSTWDKRILALLMAGAFFLWVHTNFRLSRRTAIKRKIGLLNFEYLKPFPVLASVIVLFNITPMFEPDAPSIYIEIIQLLLLLAITIHLRKVLPKEQLKSWLMIIGLYAALILGNGMSSTAFPIRSIILALNLIFLYLGLRMYKKLLIPQFSKKYVRISIWIFIVFNALAVLLNLFGRVSLAKIFGVTGVIGLTQMIGLAVFTQILLDALEMQIKVSSCSKGLFSRVSHSKTRATAKKAMHSLSVVIWLMVFLINMNLTTGTFSFLDTVLSKNRSFGSIHFTFGNVLFFCLIVYIANKLQKHVPTLFGEGSLTYDGEVAHKSSKVALIRLIIIVIGVLLAVTASGLPMDRLTVVLGAFGVGIGLGMQNIVNNFVSGIILIFERPFRIGDYVELADKKGKVKDVGIRSSILLTPQGSEVIIPNGDLLSGRLVNWTLSHDYLKTEILFKVSSSTDLEALQKVIEEEVGKSAHVMASLPAEILVNSIAAGSIELKVMAWVNSVYGEPAFQE